MAKKIVVVDDDPDILEAVQIVLEDAGYDVTASLRGDIIERMSSSTKSFPDLLLLDVLLSGKDGRVLCKLIKNNPMTQHLPVVMISAHPSAEKTVKEAGADAFLPKPFEVDNLLSVVSKLIN